jgi:hypothetical protein
MFLLFFVPFSFLEVVPSGTTQGYFHLSMLLIKVAKLVGSQILF